MVNIGSILGLDLLYIIRNEKKIGPKLKITFFKGKREFPQFF
jgi:hypothetical protein